MRVIIAEDERIARERLLALLSEHADVEVVASCRDGIEAVAAVLAHRPDVVILDIEMPELNGFDVIRQVGSE